MNEVLKLKIKDVKVIKPSIHYDDRGFFYESYNKKNISKIIGRNVNFVQDNHSRSSFGVLRGLHYQKSPYGQGKLVRVILGEIFDVAVDIRESSPTYGKWVSSVLSSSNMHQMWIPEGFAHGFLVLSEFAEIIYKTTNFYNQKYEKNISYNNSSINIKWPVLKKIGEKYILSENDKNNGFLNEKA